MIYAYSTNDQPYKGDGGPLHRPAALAADGQRAGLPVAGGRRRRITALAQRPEIDNPYFNISKNAINAKKNRIIANLGLTVRRCRGAI